ncbi:MAG: hypothetical protein O7E57_01620 [Gammaproteobacteria bacterium]|nr:hypothetical protein [Gammaproteobacteria bacterium]
MRKLIWVTLAMFAGTAFANAGNGDGDQIVQGQNLSVKERLQVIELINIAAEKEQVANAEPIDAELQAILEQAESLEEPLEKEEAE